MVTVPPLWLTLPLPDPAPRIRLAPPVSVRLPSLMSIWLASAASPAALLTFRSVLRVTTSSGSLMVATTAPKPWVSPA